jgi:hypothetical protein
MSVTIKVWSLTTIQAEELGNSLAEGDPDDFARMLDGFFRALERQGHRRHIDEFAAACTKYGLPAAVSKFDRKIAHFEFGGGKSDTT